MEEEPTKADLPNGSFVRYVKPKKKASGRSAKRPAEDPGADPTDDAAAESARRQEGLERRANGLHDALCRTYVGLDQLLSLDYLAQWHPSATKLNADDQDEYVHNVCVKLGRFSRIESMDQGNPMESGERMEQEAEEVLRSLIERPEAAPPCCPRDVIDGKRGARDMELQVEGARTCARRASQVP